MLSSVRLPEYLQKCRAFNDLIILGTKDAPVSWLTHYHMLRYTSSHLAYIITTSSDEAHDLADSLHLAYFLAKHVQSLT